MIGDFLPDGDPGNAQLSALSVIALHEHSDRVAAEFGGKDARRGADAAFEFVANHSRAAANIAFFDSTAMGSIEGVESMFGLHVETVHVVQVIVGGFGDDRQ